MNGTIIPNTPIAVDFWKIRECPQARIFFLTHLHSDHMAGLTSSWRYPIYCSKITKQLLIHKQEVKESLINVLELDVTQIIYLDNEQKEQMCVTAIEANHCPGAIMLLMEGYFGTILHTGDFRYSYNMITDTILSRYSGKIDTLYLDNTYCSPSCTFPTKENAEKQVIDIIQQYPDHDILIAMRNLGKETLLYSIGLHFQEWISVSGQFYERLQILGAPNVFKSSNSHRIRIVPFNKVSNRFVEHVNNDYPTIVIIPTALYCGIDARPYENNKKVFIVPYSDHSSFSEIVEFVSFLKPRKIIPIVKASSRGPFGCSVADRADMSQLAEFMSKKGIKNNEVVPDSVKKFMNSCLPFGAMEHKRKVKKKILRKKSKARVVHKGVKYDSPVSESEESIEIINDENECVKNTNVDINENESVELSDVEVLHWEKPTEVDNNSSEDEINNDNTKTKQDDNRSVSELKDSPVSHHSKVLSDKTSELSSKSNSPMSLDVHCKGVSLFDQVCCVTTKKTYLKPSTKKKPKVTPIERLVPVEETEAAKYKRYLDFNKHLQTDSDTAEGDTAEEDTDDKHCSPDVCEVKQSSLIKPNSDTDTDYGELIIISDSDQSITEQVSSFYEKYLGEEIESCMNISDNDTTKVNDSPDKSLCFMNCSNSSVTPNDKTSELNEDMHSDKDNLVNEDMHDDIDHVIAEGDDVRTDESNDQEQEETLENLKSATSDTQSSTSSPNVSAYFNDLEESLDITSDDDDEFADSNDNVNDDDYFDDNSADTDHCVDEVNSGFDKSQDKSVKTDNRLSDEKIAAVQDTLYHIIDSRRGMETSDEDDLNEGDALEAFLHVFASLKEEKEMKRKNGQLAEEKKQIKRAYKRYLDGMESEEFKRLPNSSFSIKPD